MLENEFSTIMLDSKAKDKDNPERTRWDFNDIVDFVKRHKGILSVHAGSKTQGIDDVIIHSLEVQQAILAEYADNVHIYEMGKRKDLDDYNSIAFPQIGKVKLMIICSDNHDPRAYTFKEKLWIKSDPTFEGLVQCLYTPTERIFLGKLPQKLDSAFKNKRIYIDSIVVKKNEAAKNTQDEWFDFELPINSVLTVIIGNKGSGKSALSDIIAHFCNSIANTDASFLNKDRFRKIDRKLADDYIGHINWLDGKTDEDISLGEIKRENAIETAQYLPQKYIEKVCNELGDEFQNEINKVIFSYFDLVTKGNSKSFDELIRNRTALIETEIHEVKDVLEVINAKIILVEDKMKPSYRKGLNDNLIKRKDDLARHISNSPVKVEKPEVSQNTEYVQKIKYYADQILDIQKQTTEKNSLIKDINAKVDTLTSMEVEINRVIKQISDMNSTLLCIDESFGINNLPLKIIYTSPEQKLRFRIEQLKSEGQVVLDEIRNLQQLLDKVSTEKDALIANSNSEEKAYQKYLLDLQEWETIKKNIQGTSDTENSILYYEQEINYIDNEIPQEYENLKTLRREKISDIFLLKIKIADEHKKIYDPIQKELDKLLAIDDDKIEFTVSLYVKNQNVSAQLLSHISRRYNGIFYGTVESQNTMNDLITGTDFNSNDSVVQFVEDVLQCIYDDYETASEKVKNRQEFYEFLTSLDYISAEYSLKMSGKGLKKLSAGQRGIVLLVFYLALSKNDIPIIIDQPEDNLDNQSVYQKLVKCIKEAKNKRQVIVVSHNPNIAVACDAEQIIYCQIEKLKNQITYESGSIENSYIREKVIDILEGTMPAFDLRSKKYLDSY